MSVLRDQYVALERVLIAQGEAAGVLKSTTALGNAREILVHSFLKTHLPQRLSIGAGELIDSHDRRSGQVDTILRDHVAPSWGIGGQLFMPVEGVAGVIEVKSHLNQAELKRAIYQVAKIKELERTEYNDGMYFPQESETPLIAIPPQYTNAYVLAFGSIAFSTLFQALKDNPDWYKRDYLRYGPEVIGVLGKGFFTKNDGHIFKPDPLADVGEFAWSTRDEPALEGVAIHVAESLRRYGLVNYPVMPYLDPPP